MKISEIKQLYEKLEVPPHIQAHMQAVGNYAKKVANYAKKSGQKVNKTAIFKASLLHDIFRLKPNHEEVAANYIEELGHANIAKLIRHHGFHSIEKLETLDQKIVFYADKRVCENKIVTLNKRFEEANSRKSIKGESGKIKEAQNKIYKLEKELIALFGNLPNCL